MNEKIRRIEEFLDISGEAPALEDICMLAGQFSAGKSRFLNTLIGFDCLPMGTYETTDVPTYLSIGEDSVFSYADGKEYRHTFAEVQNLRKGNIALESIRICRRTMDIPPGITFVDMPGINSIDPRRDLQFEEVLGKSPVVLYFLGKQISTVDMLYLDKIIGSGAKVILVRTKIDRINQSEENARDVVNFERSLYMRLLPGIENYFLSLEGECNVNEVGALKNYILKHLADDIRQSRLAKEESYLQKTLKPRLLAMREGILERRVSDRAADGDRLPGNARKKIREARKILEGRQSVFFDGFELAKKNYMALGGRYIQGIEEAQILKADIEQYILRLFGGLKEWYGLEMEDALKQIDLTAGTETKNYNFLDAVDIGNIMECASTHMLFGNISCYFDMNDQMEGNFHTKREAKKYFDQIMNRFFAEILMGFQDKYGEFIADTLQKYERQKAHEAELMLPMVQEDFEGTLAVIDGFLKEAAEDGY